jgi:hypothetical protein
MYNNIVGIGSSCVNYLQKPREKGWARLSFTATPINIIPLTPELNPSTQRCLTRFFTGDFGFLNCAFSNICVKTQQIHQLDIQFINYVW